MKILIITNSISSGNLSGGVEVVAKLHHRALREARHDEPRLLAPRPGSAGRLWRGLWLFPAVPDRMR